MKTVYIIFCIFAFIIQSNVAHNNTSNFDYEKAHQEYVDSITKDIDRATVYQAVPEQTNEDNFTTASGFKLNKEFDHYKYRTLAVSRDLLKEGFIEYGDTVKVSGTDIYDGKWIVRDTMNKRYKRTIDFLIDLDMPMGKWNNVEIKLV